MRKLILLPIIIFLFCGWTYTGNAINVKGTDRGAEYVLVVTDSRGTEVYRRDRFLSTGVRDGVDAVQSIKDDVLKVTQEMYAHIEGGKVVEENKAEVESYTATCGEYIATTERVSP